MLFIWKNGLGWDKRLLWFLVGLGMFDKETVIGRARGYAWSLVKIWNSLQNEKINASKKGGSDNIHSEPLCWTDSISMKYLWTKFLQTRGLNLWSTFFNPKYGKTGFIFPYYSLHEFAVPILKLFWFTCIAISIFFYDIDFGYSNW
jgi:hypothetical protein